MNPPSPFIVAGGSSVLIRQGCTPIRGQAQLKIGKPRPSFTMLQNGISAFCVSFAHQVNAERDEVETRNVLFDCPIEPFDRLKLCFDSPINAQNFYNNLVAIEGSIIANEIDKTFAVVYRPSAGLHRDRVRSMPVPPHGVQPRPISGPPSAIINAHKTKRAMEAPAKLSSVPPPPPRRDSSLRHGMTESSSPRSSSLPSTSNLQPPTDNRSSRSLDLHNQPDQSTIVPQPPLHGSSPVLLDVRRKSIMREEDLLDVFYPSDLTLIRRLERGSQGSVELVSTKFLRRVAVKYFDRRVRQWEAAATRELCYLLKAVTHPNIVQSRGVLFASPSEHDKPLGILMEYMECGSVHQAIYNMENQYTEIEPLDWIRQAASALNFLHKKRLVHRDVKPANMLLGDKGKRLKISDFGLCAPVDSGMTADVGTVIYMAPEVVNSGHGVMYNEKCDVYSLGISFWEMIHRRRPHEGFGPLALLSAVRDGTRPTFDEGLCSCSIQALIERMWSNEGADRPNMEEVYDAVTAPLENMGFFQTYE